jgi:hypothetical protein
MISGIILLPLCLNGFICHSQLHKDDLDDARRFDRNYCRSVDATFELSGGFTLTFSHSTNFKCVHLTDSGAQIHLIDIRYRKGQGFLKFLKDEAEKVWFQHRGSGSDNPFLYFYVRKSDLDVIWKEADN